MHRTRTRAFALTLAGGLAALIASQPVLAAGPPAIAAKPYPGISRSKCMDESGGGVITEEAEVYLRDDDDAVLWVRTDRNKSRGFVYCEYSDGGLFVVVEEIDGKVPQIEWTRVRKVTGAADCPRRVEGVAGDADISIVERNPGAAILQNEAAGVSHLFVCHPEGTMIVTTAAVRKTRDLWHDKIVAGYKRGRSETSQRRPAAKAAGSGTDAANQAIFEANGGEELSLSSGHWKYTTYPAGGTVAVEQTSIDRTRGISEAWIFTTARPRQRGDANMSDKWHYELQKIAFDCERGLVDPQFRIRSNQSGKLVTDGGMFSDNSNRWNEPYARSLVGHALNAVCGTKALEDEHRGSVVALFRKVT